MLESTVIQVADEACDWLRQRAASHQKPFILAVNLVNPHDIVAGTSEAINLWGLHKLDEINDVPEIDPAPEELDMSTKPSTQASYIKQYPRMFSSPLRPKHYHSSKVSAWSRRMYYALHARVDVQLQRILDALDASPFGKNTIISFTADHGEMLGAHGGMRQKWYTAYEEALRIPWVIAGKGLFANAPFLNKSVSALSSQTNEIISGSIDILPTLLGLSGLNAEDLNAKLHSLGRHAVTPRLLGRDWSSLIRDLADGRTPSVPRSSVYLELEDHISDSPWQVHPFLKELRLPLGPLRGVVYRSYAFDTVDGPPHIAAVVCAIPGVAGLWKLVRYWDNPDEWSQPGVCNEYVVREGKRRGSVNVREQPLPDEWALYNLLTDPTEMKNLVRVDGSPTSEAVAPIMQQLQEELRRLSAYYHDSAAPRSSPRSGRAGLMWHPSEVGPQPLLSKL